MKILFIGNGMIDTDNYPFPNQGGSVQTWGIALELAKKGHEIFLIRRNIIKKDEKIDNINLDNIKFTGIENIIPNRFLSIIYFTARICSSFYFSIKCTEKIRIIKPDVLCIIDRFSGFFPSMMNIPKIYILHVPDTLNFYKPYSIKANKLNSILFYFKKWIEEKIISKTNKLIVLNTFLEKYFKKCRINNVTLISNGINYHEFENAGDEKFILYAGRFDWNKNVLSLVKAFIEIHIFFPDYSLYLVGAGPEEEKIKESIKKNSLESHIKIIPLLPRVKLIELMNRCSIFVLPSFFEIFSVIVLEAMASGKPVISRKSMGTVDQIIHGKTGFLYNNDDELKKYLHLLLSNIPLRIQMGNVARQSIEKNFGFDQISEKYEAIFNTIAQKK
jgi:glycosyltransferase involved in cell wall biosynthesis